MSTCGSGIRISCFPQKGLAWLYKWILIKKESSFLFSYTPWSLISSCILCLSQYAHPLLHLCPLYTYLVPWHFPASSFWLLWALQACLFGHRLSTLKSAQYGNLEINLEIILCQIEWTASTDICGKFLFWPRGLHFPPLFLFRVPVLFYFSIISTLRLNKRGLWQERKISFFLYTPCLFISLCILSHTAHLSLHVFPFTRTMCLSTFLCFPTFRLASLSTFGRQLFTLDLNPIYLLTINFEIMWSDRVKSLDWQGIASPWGPAARVLRFNCL